MRIIHVSDTHGTFPKLPEGDALIVHSGDMLPNQTRGNPEIEPQYQKNWLMRNAKRFREWLAGRPMLFCRGNHDFSPLVQTILRDRGCDVADATNRLREHGGLRFYGFPYINYMCGEWNFEATEAELSDRIDRLPWGKIDVLVAHAPIAGILDECYGDHIGLGAMASALTWGWSRSMWPKAYLHGHAHEANGLNSLDGMLVSNAATVVWDLEIK
jgi:Icc-related predicted phosphoesterase